MSDKINLNVGGKEYNVPIEILNKIPYFANPIKDYNLILKNEPITILRSPLIFEHMISFILDPKHPYPDEYAYELDFYGIEYDKTKLFNPYKNIYDGLYENLNSMNKNINGIITCVAKTNNNLIQLDKNNNKRQLQTNNNLIQLNKNNDKRQLQTNKKISNVDDGCSCSIQ